MKSFAILRHAKIKGGRHLVGAGLHNGRGAATPNADPEAPPVEVLVGSAKPHRDVQAALHRLGIDKVRKGGVVAVEIFVGASPEWWQSKGWKPGCKPEGDLLALVEDWKAAQVAYLRDRCGDRLVSAIYHGDEATPHVQAFALPVIYRKDGREKGELAGREAWRLDAQVEMGSPGVLKQRQTDYANRMARFGLVRGKDIETEEREGLGETHKPARVWQQQEAKKDRERDRLVTALFDAQKRAEQEREESRRASSEALRAEDQAKEALRAVEQREAVLGASERAAMLATGRAEAVRMAQASTKAAQAAKQVELAAERVEIDGLKAELKKALAAAEAARASVAAQFDQWQARFNDLMAPLIDAVKRLNDHKPKLSGVMLQAAELKARPAKDVIEGVDAAAMQTFLDQGRSR